MKEKYTYTECCSTVYFEENKIVSFQKNDVAEYSFRVLKDGKIGIHFQVGEMDDTTGYALAEENLVRNRPYPYDLETGCRKRDKTERTYSDKELFSIADKALAHITEKYPQFTLNGSFSLQTEYVGQTNSKGMDYENKDSHIQVSVNYKHRDSKDLQNGFFTIGQRDFSFEKLYEMADNYLGNFEKQAEFPEEVILQSQYYNFVGNLTGQLDAERLALGASLLSGKLGEKVFSENFTLIDDDSDETCWHAPFWDGEGCVKENDKRVFVENGVPLFGYSDKRVAEKYNVPHTGNAFRNYEDIPGNGRTNMIIKRSDKTVKELLAGRYSIVIDHAGGGGFNETGDYVLPVFHAFLCDGEKFLGSLPPFTLTSNLFDMFGKDFIGVGSDQPVFNDKQVLVKVKITPNA